MMEDLLYFDYDGIPTHKDEVERVLIGYVGRNGIVIDTIHFCHAVVGDPRLKGYIMEKIQPFVENGWIKLRGEQ